MEAAIFSDLHGHVWQEFMRLTKAGLPDRLLHCVNVIKEVRKYCLEHNIGYVFFGGDLFQMRGVLYTLPYTLIANELIAMKRAGIHVIANPGNHDYEGRTGEINAMLALRNAGLLHCPEGSGSETYELEGGAVISVFAYQDGREYLERALEKEDRVYRRSFNGAPRVGLLHHGFKDARVGSSLEQIVKEDIDARILNGHSFRCIYSGHYHTRQPIKGLSNGWYIGSPLEHTRSNRVFDHTREPKGFLVYDFETNSHKVIPLDRPRFIVLTQWHLDAEDFGDVAGNYVDVVYDEYRGGEEKLLADLIAAGALGVRPLPTPKATAGTMRQRVEVDPSLDPREALKRYVEKVPVSKELQKAGVTKNELLRIGVELWNEAEEKH